MLPDAYIKKNGCIYGHRSRYIGKVRSEVG